MLYVTERNGVFVDEKWIIAFAWNVKSFAMTINLLFLVFSVANLNRLMKVSCRIFCICWATRLWLNSDTLEKSYVRNIYSNLKFRVWKHEMPWALKKISWRRWVGISEHVDVINVFHGVKSILYTMTNIYHKFGILLKVINVFCG